MTTATDRLDQSSLVADEDAIRRLTHEYSRAVDSSDVDRLMQLWTDDAVWDVTNFGMEIVRGADAIREFFAALVANTTHRCHLAVNHIIDVAGDTASATVYLHAFVVTPDGHRDESLGYYEDDYVRTPDGWRFQRRKAHTLLPAPAAPVS